MITTIIGLLGGILVIALSTILTDSGTIFLSFPAALITLGGTISACLIYFSSSAINNAFYAFLEMFQNRRNNVNNAIENVVKISKELHYADMIEILHSDEVVNNNILHKGLTLVADSEKPEDIKDIMISYSNSLTAQKRIAEKVFSIAGSFAPMFGMIGTVKGLVSMLSKIDDPSAIPAAMGLALITTLYGLILSSLFFIPISGQIREINHQDSRIRQIYIEGILAIQRGDNSRILEERLTNYLLIWKREKRTTV